MQFATDVLGSIPKRIICLEYLEKRISGGYPKYSISKISQNTKKTLETCGNFKLLKVQWKPLANAGVKTFKEEQLNINWTS